MDIGHKRYASIECKAVSKQGQRLFIKITSIKIYVTFNDL